MLAINQMPFKKLPKGPFLIMGNFMAESAQDGRNFFRLAFSGRKNINRYQAGFQISPANHKTAFGINADFSPHWPEF